MNHSSEPAPDGRPRWPVSRSFELDREDRARDLDQEDRRQFDLLTSMELTEAEKRLAAEPDRRAPEAGELLAVHWHPEWAPLALIKERLKLSFPRAENRLVIPTQHNRVMVMDGWAGVEVDVYERRYGLKVQLLIHFPAARLPRASAFLAMMNHTYNYRAHQLLDSLRALLDPETLSGDLKASLKGSVSDQGVELARFYARRLTALIEETGILGSSRDEMLKNRLLPDFIRARDQGESRLREEALLFISAVKKKVKSRLNPDEFYSSREVIAEARRLGGGIVIPHPPLFWPVLLDDLDVDGWEIWNPSTPGHTLFILEALNRANESRGRRGRLLAFMGDDTHMSAKFRRKLSDEKDSGDREIGFQDPWDDPRVQALLKEGRQSRQATLNEYRARMS
ncbi:MAG: hypothetical protein LBP33_08470 [Candidatus Adiutrix sp.]|jgi:hypothetical protein|nr:hypothetical protein [Candidatus Adiutrix sp.]